MSICSNPYSIQHIELDECIGLSLATITSNYQLLLQENCSTFEELERISQNITSLQTRYKSLTAQSVGLAKATVAFDGTGTASPSVYSSFNIAGVSRTGTGVFLLSFLSAFPNINYTLIGTSSMVLETNVNEPFLAFTSVQPTAFTPTSVTINITQELSGTPVNSEYISIIAYSL
jgi:hypothetical protein